MTLELFGGVKAFATVVAAVVTTATAVWFGLSQHHLNRQHLLRFNEETAHVDVAASSYGGTPLLVVSRAREKAGQAEKIRNVRVSFDHLGIVDVANWRASRARLDDRADGRLAGRIAESLPPRFPIHPLSDDGSVTGSRIDGPGSANAFWVVPLKPLIDRINRANVRLCELTAQDDLLVGPFLSDDTLVTVEFEMKVDGVWLEYPEEFFLSDFIEYDTQTVIGGISAGNRLDACEGRHHEAGMPNDLTYQYTRDASSRYVRAAISDKHPTLECEPLPYPISGSSRSPTAAQYVSILDAGMESYLGAVSAARPRTMLERGEARSWLHETVRMIEPCLTDNYDGSVH